jgi:hypothetical protein
MKFLEQQGLGSGKVLEAARSWKQQGLGSGKVLDAGELLDAGKVSEQARTLWAAPGACVALQTATGALMAGWGS